MESRVMLGKRCYRCGTIRNLERHHIFNGPYRNKSEEDGMWIWLCHDCHMYAHDTALLREYKKAGEKIWLEEFGDKDEFIRRYGKDYL